MTIKIEGDKALAKALNDLPSAVFKKVVKRANAEAMKPVVQAVKSFIRSSELPKEISKSLAKAIARKTKVYNKDGNVVTIVGPRVRSTFQTSDGSDKFIPYVKIEQGDVNEDGDRTVPVPYMRATWDALNKSVERNYGNSLRIGLTRVAAQMAKKSK